MIIQCSNTGMNLVFLLWSMQRALVSKFALIHIYISGPSVCMSVYTSLKEERTYTLQGFVNYITIEIRGHYKHKPKTLP